ncbi:glycosyltransferase family 2 protein [Halomonas shantousis]
MTSNPSCMTPPPAYPRHVAILMGTYQGEKYLAEQLDSISKQTYPNWSLWVSDDGSTDATWDILRDYQARWGEGKLHLRRGPQRGVVANFLGLLCDAKIQADYFAYADQDDIWYENKLSRALQALDPIPASRPALYGARTLLVDSHNQPIALSPPSPRTPAFANALVQNIASGNSMVINASARELLRRAGPDIDISVHDGWTYLLITACGGHVIYDPEPSLRYRQHDANLIGMQSGWKSYVKRARLLWAGQHRQHVQRNLTALMPLQGWLTPANRRRLEIYAGTRQRSLPLRLLGLWRAGIYRQTCLGTLGMLLATILKKT